jgi:ribonuclease G
MDKAGAPMYKELVINVNDHETRVSLLEDGTIVELFIERSDDVDITGNIYKGKVQRVLPGMQAAFVDVGLHQAAFIYVDDIHGERFTELSNRINHDGEESELLTAYSEPGEHDMESDKTVPIEDLLREGEEILIQVAKSPIGTKGARVTSYISLPGRFLVLMPKSDHVGISRRIEDESERARLKTMVNGLRKDDKLGYIVRTAAEGVQEEKLAYEMEFLKGLWENIQKKYKRAPVYSLLHQEITISLRAVRDLLTHEADRLIIDSKAGYDSILEFLDMFNPNLKDSVEFYEGSEPIFDAYNLEADISRALKRKVWLKSGGYIVIEQTEALVAIDVNTGRYVGTHNLEETILKTNLEAVKEIAYQIRLRDVGGIIIIDFIDMEKKSNQEKVYHALTDALRKDRSKTHVLPISEIGLVQMTRKRIRKPLNRVLCEPCFYCDGEGYLLSRTTVCHNIFREIFRDAQGMPGTRLTLKVNPKIAELLHGEENHLISSLEKAIGKQIVIYPNAQYHFEEYEILEAVRD